MHAVLAACLYWAEAQQEELEEEQLAEMFSRIRFRAIPASLLLNYYHLHWMLDMFDPDKQLLMRAVSWPSGQEM